MYNKQRGNCVARGAYKEMDNENCAMNKTQQMETDAQNEGYVRLLPNSKDDAVGIPITNTELFNETNIQNIIECSSNKNKINFSLSQEQIFTLPTTHHSTAHSIVNHEQLPIDLKKSTKTVAPEPPTSMEVNELPEFSITEFEKKNLLRKFSVSAISSNHQNLMQTHLFDVAGAYRTKVLDAAFKCSICNEAYVDPRVLDCLHSFCLDCLVDIELVKYQKSRNNDLCELDLSCK